MGGHGRRAPKHGIDWKGNDWTPESGTPAAHPNARFTAPASQCPSIDPAWEDPGGRADLGVHVRRALSKTFPLVYEAFDWNHGVFMAATMGSEATAAAIGQAGDPARSIRDVAVLRLPHGRLLVGTGSILARNDLKPPKIFRVNWFRKDENGKFIWPGYGENMRVLKWIVDRVRGRADAVESPFGLMPRYEDITWAGLDFSKDKYLNIMNINRDGALAEAAEIRQFFDTFGSHLPPELEAQRKTLEERAGAAPQVWSMAG